MKTTALVIIFVLLFVFLYIAYRGLTNRALNFEGSSNTAFGIGMFVGAGILFLGYFAYLGIA